MPHRMQERWFMPAPQAGKSIRLFCFPYAGGSPNAFRSWVKRFPDDMDVVVVRLPGRENRISEAPFSEWPPLVESVLQAIVPYLNQPFAFFGHSFGGRVIFELTRRLQSYGGPLPEHVFISGCRCPHLSSHQPFIHQLPMEGLIERIRQMNGAPEAALQDQQLMALMEPMLRADFKLSECWSGDKSQTLRVPITALSGQDDPIDASARMQEWEDYTSGGFQLRTFPGDHFFIRSSEQEVTAFISQTLLENALLPA
ncbi:predicted thioesterase involved in non-ribosomal peptide biosynthesis [Hahella chejuensis KCTC 2396]|uniref:Predicted thioesterase involved in non-ribosomal peptide biosynthesis n=1 Tax=Hahella chejuensis (strain KCTC 2396) TaxID=349521 RepID=Q2S6V8_HAHCH|nr:alpha/beta fold hydrolase [Hahella chejuensis]ABC33616.1 predicted thioesterase involved in non-ribosomal peptide biosynthesis [Hahella chejuensis KCTC 2396]